MTPTSMPRSSTTNRRWTFNSVISRTTRLAGASGDDTKDRRCHDVAYAVGAGLLLVVGRRHVVNGLAVVDEDVGAADDADGPAGLIDDRGAADATVRQQLDGLADGGALTDRNRARCHQLRGFPLVQDHAGRDFQQRRTFHGSVSAGDSFTGEGHADEADPHAIRRVVGEANLMPLTRNGSGEILRAVVCRVSRTAGADMGRDG
jgi:hypothetical protein